MFWDLNKIAKRQKESNQVRTHEEMSVWAKLALENYEIIPGTKDYEYKNFILGMATGKTITNPYGRKLYFKKGVNEQLYDELIKYTADPETIRVKVEITGIGATTFPKNEITTQESEELKNENEKLPALWELELGTLQENENENENVSSEIQTSEIKR